MLAGEGLGGVFQALLAVAGVDGGSTYRICIIDFLVLNVTFFNFFYSPPGRIWHCDRVPRQYILWLISHASHIFRYEMYYYYLFRSHLTLFC